MAPIPDERLEPIAAVEGSAKMTPATITRRRPARAERGRSRQAAQGRCAARVLRGFGPDADPGARPRDARARAARRRPRPRREAPRARADAGEVRRPAAPRRGRRAGAAPRARRGAAGSLSSYEGDLPPELEPLTTKPVVAGRQRRRRHRPRSSRPSWRSSRPRRRPSSATGPAGFEERAVEPVRDASACSRSSPAATRRRGPGRSRQGETALDAAATIHTDIARGFIRCEVIAWRDLVEAGSRAEAARRGQQRLEGKEYVVAGRRRPQHPLQRLAASSSRSRSPGRTRSSDSSLTAPPFIDDRRCNV